MANPTRFTKVGMAGKPNFNGANRGDYSLQTITAPIAIVAAATEQTTDVVLPAKCYVISTALNVITPESTGATKTIDIGLSTAGAAVLGDDVSVSTSAIVAGLGGQDGSGQSVTYTLGSDDYAELDAEIVIQLLVADGK